VKNWGRPRKWSLSIPSTGRPFSGDYDLRFEGGGVTAQGPISSPILLKIDSLG